APSGGIDPSCRTEHGEIDYKQLLSEEFSEETGLPISSISGIRARSVLEDEVNHIFDIVADIFVSGTISGVEETLNRKRNNEYKDVKIINAEYLAEFLKMNEDEIAPLSGYLIRHLQNDDKIL